MINVAEILAEIRLEYDNLYYNQQAKFYDYMTTTMAAEQALSAVENGVYSKLKYVLNEARTNYIRSVTLKNATRYINAYNQLSVFKGAHGFAYISVADFISINEDIMEQIDVEDLVHPVQPVDDVRAQPILQNPAARRLLF